MTYWITGDITGVNCVVNQALCRDVNKLVYHSNGIEFNGKGDKGSGIYYDNKIMHTDNEEYEQSNSSFVFDSRSVYPKCVYQFGKDKRKVGFHQQRSARVIDLNSISDNRNGIRSCEKDLRAAKAIAELMNTNVNGLRIPFFGL